MISVCIPCCDSIDLLKEVIDNLYDGLDDSSFEIIVADDGSYKKVFKELIGYVKVKVIDNGEAFGVGYSFDRCAEHASGDMLVLMGADVFPRKKEWLKQVEDCVRDNQIGCAASIGLNPENKNLDKEGRYVRYGARLLFKVDNNDLPKNSWKRNLRGGYRSIFEGKWATKQSDDPYEIECLMGAFYFTTKKFYDKIHGWDTEKGVKFQGHMQWGSLEPYISLKARIYGGKLMMYPNFEVGHVFGRSTTRSEREDVWWYNRLFMVHTMTEDPLKSELLSYPHRDYVFNIGEKFIANNWDKVQKVRERNVRESNGLISQI